MRRCREEHGKPIYMNGRYYGSYLNRHQSADVIVPDPKNPQSLNRFSYVYNNPVRYTDPTGHFCYDADNNEFSSGSCYDDQQQLLLDYFVMMINADVYSDLQMAENLIGASLELLGDPVVAMRAVTELVRASIDVPGNHGFEYSSTAFFIGDELERLDIIWHFDDTGFGDLAEPDPANANQMSHFMGIAYISAFQYRESTRTHGILMNSMVRGNEIRNWRQSGKKTDIEVDLGMIASDMGKALVIDQAIFLENVPRYGQSPNPIGSAIGAIQNYSYADEHPIRNWFEER